MQGTGMKRAKSSALSLTLQPNLVQDNIPLEIVPRLYIGSIHAAFNQEAISDRGITHIVNASGLPATFPRAFTYLSIELRDKEASNILACVPAANIFIEAGLSEGGSVLVHCAGGRSRSAALVTAYLMASRGWPFDYAVAMVKRARPVVQINKGFEQQLRAYGSQRCDLYAAHQMIVRHRLRALVDRRALLSGEAVTGPIPDTSPAPPPATNERRWSIEPQPQPQQAQEGILSSTARSGKNISFLSSSFKAPATAPQAALVVPVGREGSCLSSLSLGGDKGTSTSSISMDVSGDHSDAPLDGREGGADDDEKSEAYESLFGDAAPQSLKRGSQEAAGGKAVNRSLHRRGKTEQGTTLPPISPSLDPTPGPCLSPTQPPGGKSAFTDPCACPCPPDTHDAPRSTATTPCSTSGSTGGPANLPFGGPLASALGLRSPYASMSRLSLDQQNHAHLSSADGNNEIRVARLSVPNSHNMGSRVAMAMDMATNTHAADEPVHHVVPPTPKARRSSGGNGAHSLNQYHHDASSLLNARNRFSSAPALPQMNTNIMGVKQSKHELIAQQPPTPHLRLTRPGSTVQIMPPLQGLERAFLCLSCNTRLFALGNVIYLDFVPMEPPTVEVEGATLVTEEGEDDEEEEDKGRGKDKTKGERGGMQADRAVDSPQPMEIGSGAACCLPSSTSASIGLLSDNRVPRRLSNGGGGLLSVTSPCHGSSSLCGRGPQVPLPLPATSRQGSSSRFVETGQPSPRLGLVRNGSVGNGQQLFPPTTSIASPSHSVSSPLSSSANLNSSNGKPRPAPLRELVLTANANGSNRGDAPLPFREGLSLPSSAPGTPMSCTSSMANDSPPPPLSPLTSTPSPYPAHLLLSCDSPTLLGVGSPSATLFRPASSERRRWVAKMKHLECDRGGERAARALEHDVETCSKLRPYKGVWIPIEYMPWMGDILAAECGPLFCPNLSCHAEVGRYDWNDTLFKGDLAHPSELPLIGLHKAKVVVAPSPTSSRRLSNGSAASSSENTPREGLTPREHSGGGSGSGACTGLLSTPAPRSAPALAVAGGNGVCTPVGGSGSRHNSFLGTGGASTPFSPLASAAVEGVS